MGFAKTLYPSYDSNENARREAGHHLPTSDKKTQHIVGLSLSLDHESP
jgi:hypothetical protein